MNILGIHSGHDASMCLLKDGIIEKYFLSERYTRFKHDNAILEKTLKNILLSEKVDAIATSFCTEKVDAIATSFCTEELYHCLNDTISTMKTDEQPAIYSYFYKHHLCHAKLAYYNSGFDDAIVVVIDGHGSPAFKYYPVYECESIYYIDKNNLNTLYKNTVKKDTYPDYIYYNELSTKDISHMRNILGIGKMHELSSIMTGNGLLDAGKPMGLSSYGIHDNDFDDIYFKKSLNKVNKDFFDRSNIKSFLLNPAEEITKDNYKKYSNFCYAVQNQTQEVVGDLIEENIKQTNTKNVCLSGGYAMNVVANYYLLKRFPNINFYFEPICGDSGNSIGAAMDLYNELKSEKDPGIKRNTSTSFHGIYHDVNYENGKTYNTSEIANLLFSNEAVAVFQGYAEAGQRALGNRSIFFNALNRDAKDIINDIKKREWYRPFAAAVLQEDAENYFDVSLMKSSPFMTVAFPVLTDIIPGVTHVDKTCRIQTVSREDGFIYELLKEFKKITGHGILLNTSLNLAGDPLVESPEEAFNVLDKSSLKYLYFPEVYQLHISNNID